MIFLVLVVDKGIELQRDIEILTQSFSRVLDRKQAIIEALVRDLMEAEQQVCSDARSVVFLS
jgi:hypothetical protein